MNEHYAAPFNESHIGNTIGEGLESVVNELGDNAVLKEVNKNSGDIFGIPELTEYLESYDHLVNLKRDNDIAKEYLGSHIPATVFARGHARDTGEPTNYQIQEKIDGVTLSDLLGRLSADEINAFYGRNRDQILELIWSSKEVFVKYGIPLDLLEKNIVVESKPDEKEDLLMVVDPGFVTEGAMVIFDNYKPDLVRTETRLRFTQTCLHRLQQLDEWTQRLGVTTEERAALDHRTGHELDLEVFRLNKSRLEHTFVALKDKLGQENKE